MIGRTRQPPVPVRFPFRLADHATVRADEPAGEVADLAMKSLVRQRQPERHAGLRDGAVPPLDARLHFPDVIVAQPFVEGRERRHGLRYDAVAGDLLHVVARLGEDVIVLHLGLFEPPFQSVGVKARGIRGDVRPEQVERHAVMKVEIALHRGQVDDAEGPDVIGIVDLLLRHHFRGPLHDPADAGVADEHVVRLFGQHEAAGPGERIES